MTEAQQVSTAALMVPAGIMTLAFVALLHVYFIITSVAQFDKYKEKKMMVVACAMFFSFGFAIYAIVSSARIKGFALLGFGLLGLVCYGLGMQLLPPKIPQLKPSYATEVKELRPDPEKYRIVSEEYQRRFSQLVEKQFKQSQAIQNQISSEKQKMQKDRELIQQEYDQKILQMLEEKRKTTP